jgi:hypothetical protein
MDSSDWLPEWFKGEKQIEDWDVDEMVRTLLIGSEVEWIIEAEKRGFDEQWARRTWKLYRDEKSLS